MEYLKAKLLVILAEQRAKQLSDIRGEAVKVGPAYITFGCLFYLLSPHRVPVNLHLLYSSSDRLASAAFSQSLALIAGRVGPADPELCPPSIPPGKGRPDGPRDLGRPGGAGWGPGGIRERLFIVEGKGGGGEGAGERDLSAPAVESSPNTAAAALYSDRPLAQPSGYPRRVLQLLPSTWPLLASWACKAGIAASATPRPRPILCQRIKIESHGPTHISCNCATKVPHSSIIYYIIYIHVVA